MLDLATCVQVIKGINTEDVSCKKYDIHNTYYYLYIKKTIYIYFVKKKAIFSNNTITI